MSEWVGVAAQEVGRLKERVATLKAMHRDTVVIGACVRASMRAGVRVNV